MMERDKHAKALRDLSDALAEERAAWREYMQAAARLTQCQMRVSLDTLADRLAGNSATLPSTSAAERIGAA